MVDSILHPELSVRVSSWLPLCPLIMLLICLKLSYKQERKELIPQKDGTRMKHSMDHAGALQCQYKVRELNFMFWTVTMAQWFQDRQLMAATNPKGD